MALKSKCHKAEFFQVFPTNRTVCIKCLESCEVVEEDSIVSLTEKDLYPDMPEELKKNHCMCYMGGRRCDKCKDEDRGKNPEHFTPDFEVSSEQLAKAVRVVAEYCHYSALEGLNTVNQSQRFPDDVKEEMRNFFNGYIERLSNVMHGKFNKLG